jgi:chromosomal replication initiator protein
MQSTITDEILSASQKDGTSQDGQVPCRSDAESQIQAINEALADKVGQQKYRIWFKNSTKLTLADGYLKVGAPNLFIANWIENHFLNEISQVVRLVTGKNVKVTFAIDPELSGRRTGSKTISSTAAKNDRYQSRFVTDQPSKKSAAGGQQKKRLKLNLDTFVIGSANELAYGSQVVVKAAKPVQSAFVHGDTASARHICCRNMCRIREATQYLVVSFSGGFCQSVYPGPEDKKT